jgi:outer membrane protein OmpA-like peptidoglycan-associated protein
LLNTGQLIPKGDSLYVIDVQLKPIALGDRINLENIKFEGDRTEILEKSLPALDQLKEFMVINPTMTIEIQGHVNGEGKKNKRSFRKLSSARAKAIYDKLAESGVDKSRMNYIGFGNSKMVFPTPVNNRQAEANRRVEAEVTKL